MSGEADAEGSRPWLEAQAQLASELIKSPEGDRRQNLLRARAIYGDLLQRFMQEGSASDILTAASGVGNTFLVDTELTAEEKGAAVEFLDGMLPFAREHGAPGDAAVVLGQAARAHAQLTVGDTDAEHDTAIRLQVEAIGVLRELEDPVSVGRLGRAYHNLGKLHAERRVGARSQNVDRAVHSMERALEIRSPEGDPVGRARTLRALSVLYPTWSGARSRAHGRALADAAEAEATALADDPREGARSTGRAELDRYRTALWVDLEGLYRIPPEQRREVIQRQIAVHRHGLTLVSPEAEPTVWAQWMGGLGRLLGRLAHLGVEREVIEEAYGCFEAALRAVDEERHPVLTRDLWAAWGELSHEIGDFAASLLVYGHAARLNGRLFAEFGDPTHKVAEVERTRGHAAFAAYAAIREGQFAAAAELAEQECNRALTELLDARSALSNATDQQRTALSARLAEIQRLEALLRDLPTPEAEVASAHAALADHLGLDPSAFGVRRTDAGAYDIAPGSEAVQRLRDALSQQREALRDSVTAIEGAPEGAHGFGAADITVVAGATNVPIVYLMATAHGAAAVMALPDGTFDGLRFDELTSAGCIALLGGTDQFPGFVPALREGDDALESSLEAIEVVLSAQVGEALADALRSYGVTRATLVPLGRLGVLPLQLMRTPGVTTTVAPSAKALAATHGARSSEATGPAVVAGVPDHPDFTPLPFAVAEVRNVVAQVEGGGAAHALVGEEATEQALGNAVGGSALLHLACHGRFRPSAPLASYLALMGGPLTVGEVFAGEIDLSRTRLVTLSACEVGSFESRRAPDETMGFPTALMTAGAAAVVGALWPVDDTATMFFMMRFYELWLGEQVEVAEAVAGAREWLRGVAVAELAERAATLAADLFPGDVVAADELEVLLGQLEELEPTTTPFSRRIDWAAFFVTGG